MIFRLTPLPEDVALKLAIFARRETPRHGHFLGELVG
jgi:hypothetical protein